MLDNHRGPWVLRAEQSSDMHMYDIVFSNLLGD